MVIMLVVVVVVLRHRVSPAHSIMPKHMVLLILQRKQNTGDIDFQVCGVFISLLTTRPLLKISLSSEYGRKIFVPFSFFP